MQLQFPKNCQTQQVGGWARSTRSVRRLPLMRIGTLVNVNGLQVEIVDVTLGPLDCYHRLVNKPVFASNIQQARPLDSILFDGSVVICVPLTRNNKHHKQNRLRQSSVLSKSSFRNSSSLLFSTVKAEPIDFLPTKSLMELIVSLFGLLRSVLVRTAVDLTKRVRFEHGKSIECVSCIEPKFGGGNSIYLFSVYGAPGPWLVWGGQFLVGDGDRWLPMTRIRALARTLRNLPTN